VVIQTLKKNKAKKEDKLPITTIEVDGESTSTDPKLAKVYFRGEKPRGGK